MTGWRICVYIHMSFNGTVSYYIITCSNLRLDNSCTILQLNMTPQVPVVNSIIGKPENLKSYPQHIWVCVQICVGKNFICVGQKSQHIYFSQHIYWYVFRYVLGINVQNISQYIYFLRPTHTSLFPIHIPTHIS